MEMAADGFYKIKKISGFCHLSTGQEAIATSIEHSITKEDAVITAYRCHGFAYLRSSTVKVVTVELLCWHGSEQTQGRPAIAGKRVRACGMCRRGGACSDLRFNVRDCWTRRLQASLVLVGSGN
jgi:TPP-dependent pyruvate/acetoin dehydrogenase alpha subunit